MLDKQIPRSTQTTLKKSDKSIGKNKQGNRCVASKVLAAPTEVSTNRRVMRDKRVLGCEEEEEAEVTTIKVSINLCTSMQCLDNNNLMQLVAIVVLDIFYSARLRRSGTSKCFGYRCSSDNCFGFTYFLHQFKF